jgi:hypothetical protein
MKILFDQESFVILAFASLAMLGCSRAKPIPPPSEDTTPIRTPSISNEQKIRDLIEQLASRNAAPTGDGWPGLKRSSDWSEEYEKAVNDARDALEGYGKEAFPLLLENLDDQRYSLTASYSIEVNHTVGQVCRQIVEWSVCSHGGGGYKSRTGADGKGHMPPDYFYVNYRNDLKKWWRENSDKSLKQMRIDFLKWQIEQEDRIGFPDAESRRLYRDGLDQTLREVEAQP